MKRKRTNYSAEQKLKILEAYEQSGKKLSEFCREKELSIHTVTKWVQGSQLAANKQESEFVEIRVEQMLEAQEPLVLRCGRYELRIPSAFKQGHLERVLDVLESRHVH